MAEEWGAKTYVKNSWGKRNSNDAGIYNLYA
jgi:hypothetical protein